MSSSERRVVITGLGAVTPLGTGAELFWQNLLAGNSGVRKLQAFAVDGSPSQIGAEVLDYDAAKFVKQRKTIKLMARDIQLAIGSAALAVKDSNLDIEAIDGKRMGVYYGAGMIATELDEISPAVKAAANGSRKVDLKAWGKEGYPHLFPLWMLKYLPNMPACHVSIAYDAQGPNNSITVGEASSALAIGEAFRVIQRGTADIFIAGGTDSRVHPLSIVRQALLGRLSKRNNDPAAAVRPFDRNRDGGVVGEGSAALLIEERSVAKKREASIYAEILGFGAACDPANAQNGIVQAARRALAEAKIAPADLGHVVSVGAAGKQEDRDEAHAIAAILGPEASRIPVAAYKGAVGSLAAASGAVEIVASLLAIENGQLPAAVNCDEFDPEFPAIRVARKIEECPRKPFLALGRSFSGQSAALVIGPA